MPTIPGSRLRTNQTQVGRAVDKILSDPDAAAKFGAAAEAERIKELYAHADRLDADGDHAQASKVRTEAKGREFLSNPVPPELADLERVAREQTNAGNGALIYDDGERRLALVPGTTGTPRRTRWLWADRFPMGSLGLLAGPGGTGKSTVSYWLAAQLTRGTLPGELYGTPRAVIVSSVEDAWEQVILPRLLAADADLSLIYRVDATGGDLSLPRDLIGLEELAIEVSAAMLILDPLISRLGKLDTHKDAETRQALRPLGQLAERINMGVLGLIHFNKSAASDLLGKVLGSGAFVNVARSVHAVITDPEDSTGARRLLGTAKNNMGRSGEDLPTLAFTIGSRVVGVDPDDGSDVTAVFPNWQDDSQVGIREAFQMGQDLGGSAGTQVADAVELLRQLLDANGGCITAKQAKATGRAEQIGERTMMRAAKKLRLLVETVPGSFPRMTTWADPSSVTRQPQVDAEPQ